MNILNFGKKIMVKNKYIYIIILSIYFIFLPYNSFSNDINLIGKIKVYKDQDINMFLAKLIKDDGEEIVLGALGNMSKETRECVNDASDNDLIVNIVAQYCYDGIDDRTIICKNISVLDKNDSTHLIGPDIFGLKLGMSEKNAISVIKKLAEKNKYITKEGYRNDNLNFDIYEKKGDIFPIITLVFKNIQLVSIVLYNDPRKNSPYYLSICKKLLSQYKFTKSNGQYCYLTEDLKIVIDHLTVTIYK